MITLPIIVLAALTGVTEGQTVRTEEEEYNSQIEVTFDALSTDNRDVYSGIYLPYYELNSLTVRSAWKKSESEIYLYSEEDIILTNQHYLRIGPSLSQSFFNSNVVNGVASVWKDAEDNSVDIMFRNASPVGCTPDVSCTGEAWKYRKSDQADWEDQSSPCADPDGSGFKWCPLKGHGDYTKNDNKFAKCICRGAIPTYERAYDSKCVTKTPADKHELFEDKSTTSQCESECSGRGGLCYGYSWRTYNKRPWRISPKGTECIIWLEKVDRTLPVDVTHGGTYVADRSFTCDVRISYKWW